MIKKRTWGAVGLVFAGVIGVIGLAANTASADPYAITFDLSKAVLSYNVNTATLTATTKTNSELYLTLEHGGALLDESLMTFSSTPFNFSMTLNLTQGVGPENWSATGSLMWSDINTGTNAVQAAFTSTNILIYSGATYTLNINGLLSPLSGNTILVNRGNPWTFMGDAAKADLAFNADGTLGQITLPDNPQAYNIGDLFVIKTAVGIDSLDTLFGPIGPAGDQWATAKVGEIKGAIVPAPAAVALGLMGLSLVGIWMRRYA